LEEGNLDKICTINLFLTPFPYNKIPFLLIIEPFQVHFEEFFSKNKYLTITNQKYVKQNPMIKLGFPIDFFFNPENKNMELKLIIKTFQT
jgi:hypothetical protein